MAGPSRSAGRSVVGTDRETAEDNNTTPSIAAPGAERKLPPLGRRICGAAIDSGVVTLRCTTCSAWARWRSAFRLAAHALRGPQ